MGRKDTLIITQKKAIAKIKDRINSPGFLENLDRMRLEEIMKVTQVNPNSYSFHICSTQEDVDELKEFGWNELNDETEY